METPKIVEKPKF